jgi:methyl acetate hydrolase
VGVDHRRPERALSGLNAIFKAPMLDDPGSRFIYGINLDWLGQVVYAASGMKLDEAIAHGVTGPLGMTETAFVMSDAQRANSVPVHLQGEDGTWAACEIDLVQEPEYWAGGHGLHSTPARPHEVPADAAR